MPNHASPAAGFSLFDTALGACAVAWSAQAIVGMQLPYPDPADTVREMQRRFPACTEQAPPPWVRAVCQAVTDLLAGDSEAQERLLQVPLDMAGAPPFHQEVWHHARLIPPGQTLSYGEFATLLGQPGAARAVGQALGANPFAPIVPCHRVLAKGQHAGGFSAPGGVDTKLRMLQIEHAQFGAPGLFDCP